MDFNLADSDLCERKINLNLWRIIMAKNDNAHSIRWIDSLRRNIGDDVADAFAENYPLSKAANIEKKYEWAKNICDYLDGHYDTEMIMILRKECRCNDGKSIANKILKDWNKADSQDGPRRPDGCDRLRSPWQHFRAPRQETPAECRHIPHCAHPAD